MKTAEAARRSGLSSRTIRHYEDIGLIRPERSENGYRRFTDSDLHELAFLARARSPGFRAEDCRVLLGPYEDTGRSSGEVKRIAEKHLGRLDRQLAELETMRRPLGQLVKRCAGDDRPECPIIDRLASTAGLSGSLPAKRCGLPSRDRSPSLDCPRATASTRALPATRRW